LTLDDDVAVALKRLQKSRSASFRDVVNDALRRGLKDMSSRVKRTEQFRTRAVALGQLRLGSLDNIADALAIAEDEGRR
jgi:hypothetical protein